MAAVNARGLVSPGSAYDGMLRALEFSEASSKLRE